jgi:hypothetical protein
MAARDLDATHKSWEVLNDAGEQTGHGELRGNDRVFHSTQGDGDPPLKVQALKTFENLVLTAREELKRADEQTDENVIQTALITLPSWPPGVIKNALNAWIYDISSRRGTAGRLRKAAQFLASRAILTLSISDPPSHTVALRDEELTAVERMQCACMFAHAWYEWNKEVNDDHRKAYGGVRAAQSVAKANSTKGENSQQRDNVIRHAVGHLLDRGDRISRIAESQHENVNNALVLQSLPPISFRKERFDSGKKIPHRKRFNGLIRELQRIKSECAKRGESCSL